VPTHAFAAKYDGLYQVMVARDKVFIVAVGGQWEVVSVDRLKPYVGVAPLELALPPRRGRLRKFVASLVAQRLAGGSVAAWNLYEERVKNPRNSLVSIVMLTELIVEIYSISKQ
jgi:hypothetical protein